LECDIDVQQFMCEGGSSGVTTLTTYSLLYILTEWARETDKLGLKMPEQFDRVEKLLEEASIFVCVRYSFSECPQSTSNLVRLEIALSIQMLGHALANVYYVTWKQNWWPEANLTSHHPQSKPRSSVKGFHLLLLFVHSVEHTSPSYFDAEKSKLP
jgi:hypothetical protein